MAWLRGHGAALQERVVIADNPRPDGILRVARLRMKWRIALGIAGHVKPPPCACAGRTFAFHTAAIETATLFEFERSDEHVIPVLGDESLPWPALGRRSVLGG